MRSVTGAYLKLPAVFAVAAAAGTGLLRARAPQLAAPLGGYGLMLAAMSTLAAAPGGRLRAGGLAFALSDGLVTTRRTLLRGEHPRRVAEGTVLGTYALAQLLLVDGMLALGNRK